jgi:hypothetical protein
VSEPQELLRTESHHALLVLMSLVAPSKTDFAVLQSDQPMVGDGNPVRVVTEVFEDVLRSEPVRRQRSADVLGG